MYEISLRQYLAKQESLLDEGHYDEVIFHCHHILQHFPKNLAAYRYLGRALLGEGRWVEASEVLRRALSVAPDDRALHAGLSQSYYATKNYGDAIWHLERVYEQNPNNKSVSKRLKELYQEHAGVSDVRLQLTTAAVARQYARSGLYDQAIDILNKTLANRPDRVDLQLLLARILWEAGQAVEAAETALDVLERLPDCLEANIMMAGLWLAEQRPSDAQRYLSRIELVDPYLAMEMVRGEEEVEDELFELEIADYRTAAARRMTQARPDWLTDLGDVAEIEEPVEEPEEAEAVGAEVAEAEEPEIDLSEVIGIQPPEVVEEQPVAAETDDDLFDISDILGESVPADEEAEALPDLFEDLEVEEAADDVAVHEGGWLDEVKSLETLSTQVTGPLPTLDDVFEDEEIAGLPSDQRAGVSGLLRALEDHEPELPGKDATAQLDDLFGDDSLAALEFDTGELAHAESEGEELDEDEGMVPLADTDPLVWAEEEVDTTGELTASSDAEDPLAWMQDSGIEVVEGGSGEPQYKPYEEDVDAGMPLQDPGEVDPLAWMEGSGIEVIEDETEPVAPEDAADDPFAWMHDSGVDLVEDEAEAPQEPVAEPEPVAAEETADPFDWLGDDSVLDEMLDVEALTDREQVVAPGEDTSPVDGPVADWQDTMSDSDTPEWLDSEPFDSEEEPGGMDVFEDETAGEIDDPLDWMAEPETPELPDSGFDDAEFDWGEELASLDREEAAAEEEGEAEPVIAEATTGEEAETAEEVFEEEEFALEAEESPDWLADVSHEEEPEEEIEEEEEFALEAEETPDWLADIGEEPEEAVGEFAEVEEEFEEEEEEFALEAEETPDWLADIGEEPEEAIEEFAEVEEELEEEEFALEAEETPDWLADIGEEAEEEEPEEEEFVLEAEETPDWLADVSHEEETEEELEEEEFALEAEETPDWLADIGEEVEEAAEDTEELLEEEEEEEFVLEAEDTPDWLADLEEEEGVAEEAEEEEFFIETEETPDWLIEEEGFVEDEEEEPVAAEAEESPDWLVDVGEATARSEDETYAVSPMAGTPDWLADASADESLFEDEETLAAEVTEEESEWLAAETPGAEADFDFASFEEDEDWLAAPDLTAEPEAEGEVPVEEADLEEEAWLTAAEPEIDMVDSADVGYTEEKAAFADELEEAIAPAPADNAPDWLNAMVPGLDVDYEAPEDAPIEQEYLEAPPVETAAGQKRHDGDFAWLTEIVEEEVSSAPESLPGVAPAPLPKIPSKHFTFSRPPAWLRGPSSEAVAQAEPVEVEAATETADRGEEDDVEDADDWAEFDPDFSEIGDDLPSWLADDEDLFEE